MLTTSQNLPTLGTIATVNVGAYTNSACTTNCTSISWPAVAPGNSTSVTIYIKNYGTVPLTLNMTSSSWTPSNANSFITLTWDQENTTLAANNSTEATLTITVSSSITGITTFSFNIAIIGSQT